MPQASRTRSFRDGAWTELPLSRRVFRLRFLGPARQLRSRRSTLASPTFGQTRSKGALRVPEAQEARRRSWLSGLTPAAFLRRRFGDTVRKPALTPAFVQRESTTGTSPCSRRRPSARKTSLAF